MKMRFLLGAAAGYVLGTRAGRERYEQIRTTLSGLTESDMFAQVRSEFSKLTGASSSTTDRVTPPVIVGPGPDGATGSPNSDVVLPDLESSTSGSIKGDIPATAGDEGSARRRDSRPTG